MYQYKTKDGRKSGYIPGVGTIVDGTITSARALHNHNLVLISSEGSETPTAAPANVHGVAAPSEQGASIPQPQAETEQTNKEPQA